MTPLKTISTPRASHPRAHYLGSAQDLQNAKSKFAMISAATLSVKLAFNVRKVKKRKNRFSVDSQNLIYTIFCEFTVSRFSYIENARVRFVLHLPLFCL